MLDGRMPGLKGIFELVFTSGLLAISCLNASKMRISGKNLFGNRGRTSRYGLIPGTLFGLYDGQKGKLICGPICT